MKAGAASTLLAGMYRIRAAIALGDTELAESLLADYIDGAEQVDGVKLPDAEVQA